jgi:hypothetical protein
MGTQSEIEAKKTSYEPFIAPRPYSFELNTEMLELLRKEFDPVRVVSEFARLLAEKGGKEEEQLAEKVFGGYGAQWMIKAVQLGEEYPDRTYEMLKEAADQTGELVFPLVLQRFIEIAYLGTQQFRKLTIMENWTERLVYDVNDCYTFKVLQEKCGLEVAGRWPCRHACLMALRTVGQEFHVDVRVEVEAAMVKEGHCQFALNRR